MKPHARSYPAVTDADERMLLVRREAGARAQQIQSTIDEILALPGVTIKSVLALADQLPLLGWDVNHSSAGLCVHDDPSCRGR